MRYLYPLFYAALLFCFSPIPNLFAQQWKRLSQSPLGLSYEVPRNWFVGGVLDEKQCNCESGTLNSSMKDQTNMVVFASRTLSLAEMQAQNLEGYHFLEAPNSSQQLKTEFFEFEKQSSRWREDATLQVVRLSATREGRHYLIYFWGEAAALLAQKENLTRIISSIRPATPANSENSAPAMSAPDKDKN